jgi:hypothetical protein
MVSPCKCSGTMRFVHVECLQTWIQRKGTGTKDGAAQQRAGSHCTFVPKRQHCELCKTTYPSQFVSEGVRFDILELSKPTNSAVYVVFEVFPVSPQPQPPQSNSNSNNNNAAS